MTKWRSERVVRDTLHLLQASKAKAAQLGRAIVICGVANGDQHNRCQKEWGQKVIAFVDIGNDGHFSEGDRVFQTVWPISKNSAMRLYSNRYRYVIRPNGTLKSTPGSVTACMPGGPAQGRRLVVDRVGRVRITRLDSKGVKIAC